MTKILGFINTYIGLIYAHFPGLLGVLAHWPGYMDHINVSAATNHRLKVYFYNIKYPRNNSLLAMLPCAKFTLTTV